MIDLTPLVPTQTVRASTLGFSQTETYPSDSPHPRFHPAGP